MNTEGQRFYTGPVDDPMRYRVDRTDLERVETGGEGLVYRAHDTTTGRDVALKLLTGVRVDDFGQLEERADTLVGLAHPSLMEQHEVFLGTALADTPGHAPNDEFDVAYTVAGWIDGQPLATAATTASSRVKLRWISDLAAAIDMLHHIRTRETPHGIVHRDIKPSNIRVRDDGTAVLLDYGVARPVEHTDMTQGVGTYLWRAPETLAGGTRSTGPATDVWGLGAVAHWLLVGEPPQLDGSGPARERIATSSGAAQLVDRDGVARHVAALLHTSPDQRPTDLEQWSKQLTRLSRRRYNRTLVRHRVTGLAAMAALLALCTASSSIVADAGTNSTKPELASIGQPRVVLADHFGYQDQVRDGVMLGALAYELAGTTEPSLVRSASVEVLEGDTRCHTFDECGKNIRAGRRIRYIGVTAPSPLMRTADYSVSQAVSLAPFPPDSPPSNARSLGASKLFDDARVRCGSSASPIGRCSTRDDSSADGAARPSGDEHDRPLGAPLRISVVDGVEKLGWENPCPSSPTGATNAWARSPVDEVNRAGGVLGHRIELVDAPAGADIVIALDPCHASPPAEPENPSPNTPVLTQIWKSSLPAGDGALVNGEYRPKISPWPPPADSPSRIVYGSFSAELAEPGVPDDVWSAVTMLQLAENLGANRIVLDLRDRGVECPLDSANPAMLASVAGLQGVAIPAVGLVCSDADERRESGGLSPNADQQSKAIWIIQVRSLDHILKLPKPTPTVPRIDLGRVFVIPAFNPGDGS